jgi:exodeoxyribonuclease V alpha subunit
VRPEAQAIPARIETGGLEAHVTRLLTRLIGREEPLLALAARLVCRATGEGNICASLADAAGQPLATLGEDGAGLAPPFPLWCEILRREEVVGRPGEVAPLILDDAGRLYLYRYWAYERGLAEDLAARLADDPAGIEPRRLRDGLDRLFPRAAEGGPDRQRLAAAVAVLKRLCVISGGPGTGKTTTVVRILALLLEQAEGPLRIALAAPTGKAAARMQEAIRTSRETLRVEPHIRERIPTEATTIHRLLGFRPGSVGFRHDRDTPLPVDAVVVDEASMVDLALMAKLVQAVPRQARLILLGDKDQLASVEAGAVLGDICGGSPGISPDFRRRLLAVAGQEPSAADGPGGGPAAQDGPPIQDAIVELTQSYRFSQVGGIGRLAGLVNAGDGRAALDLLERGECPDLGWRPLASPRELPARLAERAERLGAPLASGTPEAALEALDRFRILSAHRAGPYGVEALNGLVAAALEARGAIRPRALWYPGRPVLVTANDYAARLFNGDLGIALPDPAAGGALRVFFRPPEGVLRRVLPGRLPDHETAYATTVHKSQGSEADEVLLILPDALTPVLTRELVYTAVTRARKRVEIWGDPAVFAAAAGRRLSRSSGLRDALWGAA